MKRSLSFSVAGSVSLILALFTPLKNEAKSADNYQNAIDIALKAFSSEGLLPIESVQAFYLDETKEWVVVSCDQPSVDQKEPYIVHNEKLSIIRRAMLVRILDSAPNDAVVVRQSRTEPPADIPSEALIQHIKASPHPIYALWDKKDKLWSAYSCYEILGGIPSGSTTYIEFDPASNKVTAASANK